MFILLCLSNPGRGSEVVHPTLRCNGFEICTCCCVFRPPTYLLQCDDGRFLDTTVGHLSLSQDVPAPPPPPQPSHHNAPAAASASSAPVLPGMRYLQAVTKHDVLEVCTVYSPKCAQDIQWHYVSQTVLQMCSACRLGGLFDFVVLLQGHIHLCTLHQRQHQVCQAHHHHHQPHQPHPHSHRAEVILHHLHTYNDITDRPILLHLHPSLL